MRYKTVWIWVFAILGALGIVGSIGVEAATPKFNSDLMNRDLRIMEGILEEILGEENSGPVIWGDTQATRVQGTYYDGYGILFLVEGSLLPHRVVVHGCLVRNSDILFTKEDDISHTYMGDTIAADSTAATDDVINLQKEHILEFLGSYAGAIRQLKPDDQISIRVNPGRSATHAPSISTICKRFCQL
jgi:hypothetical protein